MSLFEFLLKISDYFTVDFKHLLELHRETLKLINIKMIGSIPYHPLQKAATKALRNTKTKVRGIEKANKLWPVLFLADTIPTNTTDKEAVPTDKEAVPTDKENQDVVEEV